MESIINELKSRTQAAIAEKERFFNACVDEAFDNAIEACRKAADEGKYGAYIRCAYDTEFISRLVKKLETEGIHCTALRSGRLHGGIVPGVSIAMSWGEERKV